MKTKGLMPLFMAVFAKIVSPIVQPSIVTINANGITSSILPPKPISQIQSLDHSNTIMEYTIGWDN